ncbi:MAG: hypothetical protein Q4C67_11410, partial [Deinococcus sp.]|nr:hypothetical protein [Deinococcus sp.]
MRRDDQIQNRFTPVTLPRWQLDVEFLQLLASFEATLPLGKASGLASQKLAPLLLDMSGGLIGELSSLLKRATERAVTSGSERIDRSLLLDLGWVPPGERDRMASAAQDGLKHRIDYNARVKAMLSGASRAPAEDTEA